MRGIILVLILIFLPCASHAIDATVTGTQITLDYTEPTTNKDGSLLTDLDHTTIYYDKGEGTVKAKDVPATALTGGGSISEQFVVPVAEDTEADVNIWATATDTSGNESADSEIITKRIDRLAPGAPK